MKSNVRISFVTFTKAMIKNFIDPIGIEEARSEFDAAKIIEPHIGDFSDAMARYNARAASLFALAEKLRTYTLWVTRWSDLRPDIVEQFNEVKKIIITRLILEHQEWLKNRSGLDENRFLKDPGFLGHPAIEIPSDFVFFENLRLFMLADGKIQDAAFKRDFRKWIKAAILTIVRTDGVPLNEEENRDWEAVRRDLLVGDKAMPVLIHFSNRPVPALNALKILLEMKANLASEAKVEVPYLAYKDDDSNPERIVFEESKGQTENVIPLWHRGNQIPYYFNAYFKRSQVYPLLIAEQMVNDLKGKNEGVTLKDQKYRIRPMLLMDQWLTGLNDGLRIDGIGIFYYPLYTQQDIDRIKVEMNVWIDHKIAELQLHDAAMKGEVKIDFNTVIDLPYDSEKRNKLFHFGLTLNQLFDLNEPDNQSLDANDLWDKFKKIRHTEGYIGKFADLHQFVSASSYLIFGEVLNEHDFLRELDRTRDDRKVISYIRNAMTAFGAIYDMAGIWGAKKEKFTFRDVLMRYYTKLGNLKKLVDQVSTAQGIEALPVDVDMDAAFLKRALWVALDQIPDSAMAIKGDEIVAVNQKGGIDFSSDKALTVQNNGQGIRFHIDPAMLEEFMNASGFTPVVISIKPLVDLRSFLQV